MQVLTIGHTCSGTCICTKEQATERNRRGNLVVNPGCVPPPPDHLRPLHS